MSRLGRGQAFAPISRGLVRPFAWYGDLRVEVTAHGFLSIVEIFIDDVLFHDAVEPPGAGVTVHLMSTTGLIYGSLRFIHRATVSDLVSALTWVHDNWVIVEPPPEEPPE